MTQHLLGQQSIVEFMGLHLDVRQIHEDNKVKVGVRKYVGVLINQEDKLTKEIKQQRKQVNKIKYGLPRDFYQKIKLPPPTEIKVFCLENIINHKKDLSTIERLKMLYDLLDYIRSKQERLRAQKEQGDQGVNIKAQKAQLNNKLVNSHQGPTAAQREEFRRRIQTNPNDFLSETELDDEDDETLQNELAQNVETGKHLEEEVPLNEDEDSQESIDEASDSDSDDHAGHDQEESKSELSAHGQDEHMNDSDEEVVKQEGKNPKRRKIQDK